MDKKFSITVQGRLVLKDSPESTQYRRGIVNGFIQQVDFVFPADKTYIVALDQSTTTTGLTVLSTDLCAMMCVDITNALDTRNKEYMFSQIKDLLKRTLKDRKIRDMISETPVKASYGTYRSNLLRELHGIVKSWKEDVFLFEEANHNNVLPQVWRKFAKVKGANGAKPDKQRIAECIVEQVPEFKEFFEHYSANVKGSYDSFESLGIALGYMRYAYDEYDRMKIHGEKEKTHKSFVFYDYVKTTDISYYEDLIPKYEMFQAVQPSKFLVYNDAYNLFDNIRMASSNYDMSYTILPHSEFEKLKWQYRWQEQPGYNVVMIVVRKRDNVTDSFVNGLMSVYECNTVVVDDTVSKKKKEY